MISVKEHSALIAHVSPVARITAYKLEVLIMDGQTNEFRAAY